MNPMKKFETITRHCRNVKLNVHVTCEYTVQEEIRHGVKYEVRRKLLSVDCENARECAANKFDCMWASPVRRDVKLVDYLNIT